MNLMTRKQMAAHLGITYQWISVIARADGFPAPIKKSQTGIITNDGTYVPVAARPSWLYDFDEVKTFINEKLPLIAISAKKKSEGQTKEKVACGNCGCVFEKTINRAKWFCSRQCKEKAKRERLSFSRSNAKRK